MGKSPNLSTVFLPKIWAKRIAIEQSCANIGRLFKTLWVIAAMAQFLRFR
jgi:hypothetical protein